MLGLGTESHTESRIVSHEAIVMDVRSAFLDGAGDWVTKADSERLLVATEGDVPLARDKLKQAVNWRQSTLDGWLAVDGPREMRVIGYGKDQRPLCYHCAVHQHRGDMVPSHWTCCWHKAITEAQDPFIQVDVVLDCVGFQLGLNLSIAPYLNLATCLDSFFAERIHCLIILDFPIIAGFLWRLAKPVCPPKTYEKIKFISRNDPHSMEELYNLCIDSDMYKVLTELLHMNATSTPSTGREASHRFTDEFCTRQKQQFCQKT